MKSNDAKKKQNSEWWTSRRLRLLNALDLSGMTADSATAVILGLETEEQQDSMLHEWIAHYDKTGKFLSHNEIMKKMLFLRGRTSFSLTGWTESSDDDTTEES